jgi:hypothetical protein
VINLAFNKKDNDNKDILVETEDKKVNSADINIKASPVPPQPPKPDPTCKVEECKIKFIEKGKVYFEFKEKYTLVLPIDKEFDKKSKTIKIAYKSEIGKPDFKYWIEK